MVNFSDVELNLNSDDSDGSNSELLHYIYIIRIISTKAGNYLFFKKKLCIKKIKRTKRRQKSKKGLKSVLIFSAYKHIKNDLCFNTFSNVLIFPILY